jgi:hypothetical protein
VLPAHAASGGQPASRAGAAAPLVAAKTTPAPANDATVDASEVASVRTWCRSSLKPISTRGSCLMSQPTAPATGRCDLFLRQEAYASAIDPAAPNSLTAAWNSTSLCSANYLGILYTCVPVLKASARAAHRARPSRVVTPALLSEVAKVVALPDLRSEVPEDRVRN